MIKRRVYLDCVEILSQFPVLAIVGPRQCGKTTLARQLQGKQDLPTVYLDLEDPIDQAKLADPELYLSQQEEKLVILDEIQLRPDLFNLLRSLIDRNRRPSRFIILGSVTPHRIRGSFDSLAGRISYLELSPLSWTEIQNEVGLNDHWFRGGYPDAVFADGDKSAQHWLKNYILTYVQRDLGQLGLNIQSTMAHRLLSTLSHLHGRLVNYTTIANSLGVTSPTGRHYTDFLVDSFILRKLQPFYQNTKKRLVKSPKLYYRDSGVLHYLHRVGRMEQLFGHPIAGASWEGYVIEEIARKYEAEYDLFFYRTARGAECDLVLTRNMKPEVALEIKLTNSPRSTRGYYESIQDLQTSKNFIVTPGSDRFPVGNGIEAISFKEWMNLEL